MKIFFSFAPTKTEDKKSSYTLMDQNKYGSSTLCEAQQNKLLLANCVVKCMQNLLAQFQIILDWRCRRVLLHNWTEDYSGRIFTPNRMAQYFQYIHLWDSHPSGAGLITDWYLARINVVRMGSKLHPTPLQWRVACPVMNLDASLGVVQYGCNSYVAAGSDLPVQVQYCIH
jgi:hypothetical protein